MTRAKNIKIDPELHHRFKTLCSALGIKMQDATDRMLRDWVEAWEPQKLDLRGKPLPTVTGAIPPKRDTPNRRQ